MKDVDLKKTKALLEMYAGGKKIAAAVSGGRDSMCLLNVILNCPKIKKSDLIVINVDHGIRGETSARDSKFVADFCAAFGVECLLFKTDILKACEKTGRGAEEEGREYRRKVFSEVCRRRKVELVLTAHHKSDNAETVLMNIMRGSGGKGISGIRTTSDLYTDGEKTGELFRPMLGNTREEIDEYARRNGVNFVEDETNEDINPTRNFIRNRVLPLLNERFRAENALDALSVRAREDDEFIAKFVDESKIKRTVGGYRIEADALQTDTPIASRYALALLRRMTSDYTRNSVEAVIECAHLIGGGRREISAKLSAVNEYGFVTLYENVPRTDIDYEFSVGGFDFLCFTAEIESAKISAEAVREKSGGDKSELSRTLYVDFDKVPQGARIRNRKIGDDFEPFGGGNGKLKRFLIDSKIPRRLRDCLPLLCDGKTVLAVIGAEISPHLSVDKDTKRVLKLTLSKGGSKWKE